MQPRKRGGGKGEWLQGRFKAHNPDRYSGDVEHIFYRSSWELSFMRRLDHDPRVVRWSSEEVIVPYKDPVTQRFRRYFPDFLVTLKEAGQEVTILIEIKPSVQTKVPKRGKRKSNRKYLEEAFEFARNQAKWESAARYCKKKGYEWIVLTEKELPHWRGLHWKRIL